MSLGKPKLDCVVLLQCLPISLRVKPQSLQSPPRPSRVCTAPSPQPPPWNTARGALASALVIPSAWAFSLPSPSPNPSPQCGLLWYLIHRHPRPYSRLSLPCPFSFFHGSSFLTCHCSDALLCALSSPPPHPGWTPSSVRTGLLFCLLIYSKCLD